MFYGDSTQDTRSLFFSSWDKYKKNQTLSSLETQIVDVIISHPEYHALLDAVVPQQDQSYFPELGQTNPFLHMGLHLALRDQVATDRPMGIATIYKQLFTVHNDSLHVEHLLMERLAEGLWQAQRHQCLFDDTQYLNACYQLIDELARR